MTNVQVIQQQGSKQLTQQYVVYLHLVPTQSRKNDDSIKTSHHLMITLPDTRPSKALQRIEKLYQ